MSIVVAAALVLGLTGLVQAATEDGDPPPLLLLPSWGDVPGGRIVLPDGSAAVTFPDDWGAVALTEERKADVLAADPNAEEGLGLSSLQVMAETEGAPQESCLLRSFPIPDGEVAEDIVRSIATAMGPDEFRDVMVDELMLHAGHATRVGWWQVVENPERFDEPREMYVTMLGIGHLQSLYLLFCSGMEPLTGQWESIAESMEWLELSTASLPPAVEDSDEVQLAEEATDWEAFSARYGGVLSDNLAGPLGGFNSAAQHGDLVSAGQHARELVAATQVEMDWLDEHPPQPCYSAAHRAITAFWGRTNAAYALVAESGTSDVAAIVEALGLIDESEALSQDAVRLMATADCEQYGAITCERLKDQRSSDPRAYEEWLGRCATCREMHDRMDRSADPKTQAGIAFDAWVRRGCGDDY